MFNRFLNSNFIAVAGSICSIIALIITFIEPVVKLPGILDTLLPFIPYLTIGLLTISVIAYWLDNYRLRIHAHDGMKYTFNCVKISVDIKRRIYRFSYEKHFKIISNESPKWFKGQFYCNRHLGDCKQTREYYQNHQPSWQALCVFANIKYRRPGEKQFSSTRLKVVPITNNSYYIPFHILYESPGSDGGYISLERGTRVILNYGYEVSADLWGSYLNRTLSFFGERTKVIFSYPNTNNSQIDVTLHRLSPNDGAPEKIRDCQITGFNDDQVIHEIDLPSKSLAKFRIWWDSEKLLSSPITENLADDSKMTDF